MEHKKKTLTRITRRQFLKYGVEGGLAAGLGGGLILSSCRNRPARVGGRPNVILITLDTTRADKLGCYGYKRNTSPNLDILAEQSVFYKNAIATSSWTLPSHASLFTGKFTASHGAKYDPDGPLRLTDGIEGSQTWSNVRARGLSPHEMTLAALFREKGFQTGGVAGGPWLKKIFGLNMGFDFYDDNKIETNKGRDAQSVTACALNWIRKVKHKEFFLFLNYYDPHGPYSAPKEFEKVFLPNYTGGNSRWEINGLYDAEILYMDFYIGELLKQLKSWGLYDNSWIIVTSDHGELLGEHGKYGHGNYLSQEELHIPLFMKYPKGEVSQRTIDAYFQLVDIFAMVCDRFDIALPDGVQGSSKGQADHPVIAETYPLEIMTPDGQWRAVYDMDMKFVWSSLNHHQLFNLKDDPHEQANLVYLKTPLVAQMSEKMNNYLDSLPKPMPADKAVELDPQTKEALKSLGYVK